MRPRIALTPGSAREDLLTRTTLRLGGGTADFAIDEVIRALQRVPGVLTVEPDAGGANALVAHDAAVPLSSLVGAASSAGAVAHVVGAARVLPSSNAALPVAMPMDRSHLRTIAVTAIVAVIFLDIALPSNTEKRWVFLVPFVVLCVFTVVKRMAGRRR